MAISKFNLIYDNKLYELYFKNSYVFQKKEKEIELEKKQK